MNTKQEAKRLLLGMKCETCYLHFYRAEPSTGAVVTDHRRAYRPCAGNEKGWCEKWKEQ